MSRPSRRKHHPLCGRQRRDAPFGRVHRVFDAELSVFALQRLDMPERAANSRVELEHQQLHRDDANQGEGKQADPKTPSDQPVQERAAGDALERMDASQRDARSVPAGRPAHRPSRWAPLRRCGGTKLALARRRDARR